MSSTPPPVSAVGESKPSSFLGTLVDVYVAPRDAFAGVVRRPRFWAPLLGAAIVNLMFTVVWVQKTDFREFMKARNEESPQTANMPAEQREIVLGHQVAFMRYAAWIGPPIVGVMVAVTAGFLLFVYRFFYAGQTTFAQAMAITSWVFLAVGLVSTPLLLLTLFLKDDWTLNPQDVLQANPTLLFEKTDVAKPLWAFLSSLDLFSFWSMILLATGFGISARVKTGSAIWGVAIPWAIYVLGKVALAAVF